MSKGLLLAFAIGVVPAALASSRGEGSAVEYGSPTGVKQQCLRLSRMPGARCAELDARIEQAPGAIDLHPRKLAMCPMLFSTSPGELKQVVVNTLGAAALLRAGRKAGPMRFDREPAIWLKDVRVAPAPEPCDGS